MIQFCTPVCMYVCMYIYVCAYGCELGVYVCLCMYLPPCSYASCDSQNLQSKLAKMDLSYEDVAIKLEEKTCKVSEVSRFAVP